MHTNVCDVVFGGIVLRLLRMSGRLTTLIIFMCASIVASACNYPFTINIYIYALEYISEVEGS